MLAATHTIGYREAAATAAAIHMHYEGEVIETPLRSFADDPALDGVAVLAPTQGVVEFFPSDAQPVASLARAIETAAGQGWSVAIIVPARRLGEAHHDLRGARARLQPWWADEDRICFGGPEVA